MVETWVAKTRSKVAALGWKPFHWMRILPARAWIVLCALAFAGGRLACVKSTHPAHLKEIAAAFGGASLLEKPAQFSHDFSRFTYVTVTDTRGVGLFLRDRPIDETRLVTAQTNGTGDFSDIFNLQALPWSPDAKMFAYSVMGSLTICPTDSTQPATTIPLETNAYVSALVWLNPSELVWMDQKTLGHASKSPNGPWTVETTALPGKMSSLTAIDSHVIAWTEDGYLCRFDFDQPNASLSLMRPSANPKPLTNGLILWFDASALKLANGEPISGLTDLSPSRNPAVAGTNTPRFNAPGSANSLNAKGTIHFSHTNNSLATRDNIGVSGNAPRTVFAVMRRDWMMMIGHGNAGENGEYFGLSDQFDGLFLPATMDADNKQPNYPREWSVLTALHDGASQRSYVNGTFMRSTQSKLRTTDSPFELGGRAVYSGNRWRAAVGTGDFAEALFYNRCLSREERQQVENYLSIKWFGINHLNPGNPLIWRDPGLENISSFLYSKETGQCLITTTNADGSALWLYTPSGTPATNTARIVQDYAMGDVRWTSPGHFIYCTVKQGRAELCASSLTNSELRQLVGFKNIRSFTPAPDGKKIMVWGVLSNEPGPGVWECDLDANQTASVLSFTKHPTRYVKEIKYSSGEIKLPSGSNVTVTLFYPLNFNPHKKYPLILGDTVVTDALHGTWLHTGEAAGGAFVAIVNRRWWPTEIEKWEPYVRGYYDLLQIEPSIDTGRVYLFSASAETQYMNQLLEKTPNFCVGAIYLNPGSLPDFAKTPPLKKRPRIFINAGGEEHEEDRFKQYQEQALKAGAIVEYYTHPTENHRFVGSVAKETRLQALNHFIFEE